jgi:hypothetical protein
VAGQWEDRRCCRQKLPALDIRRASLFWERYVDAEGISVGIHLYTKNVIYLPMYMVPWPPDLYRKKPSKPTFSEGYLILKFKTADSFRKKVSRDLRLSFRSSSLSTPYLFSSTYRCNFCEAICCSHPSANKCDRNFFLFPNDGQTRLDVFRYIQSLPQMVKRGNLSVSKQEGKTMKMFGIGDLNLTKYFFYLGLMSVMDVCIFILS